jgi:hypothetical protein
MDSLAEITDIFAGDAAYSCALNRDLSVTCWGSISKHFEAGTFPELSLGGRFRCETAFHNKLSCWSESVHLAKRKLRRSSRLALCSLEGNLISCDSKQTLSHRELPQAFDIQDFSIGKNHICFLSVKAVSCEGDDAYRQSSVPVDKLKFGPSLATQGSTRLFLGELASYAYDYDRLFLAETSQLLSLVSSESNSTADAFILNSFVHWFVSFPYAKVRDSFLFQIKDEIAAINFSLGLSLESSFVGDLAVNSGKFDQLADLALNVLISGIRTAKPVMSLAEMRRAEELIGRLADCSENKDLFSIELARSVDALAIKLSANPYLQERASVLLSLSKFLLRVWGQK